MRILNVKYHWVRESDLRLDAGFHLSEGRISKKVMEHSPYHINTLMEISIDIYNGTRFKRQYIENKEKGLSFMGTSDMLKKDLDKLKLISKKLTRNISKLLIEKNWILVRCSGTIIGNTIFSNDD